MRWYSDQWAISYSGITLLAAIETNLLAGYQADLSQYDSKIVASPSIFIDTYSQLSLQL